MNTLTSRFAAAALLAAMAVLASTPTLAADASRAAAQLPGQKVDSGLGDLPHYSQWADPTGRNPLRPVAAVPSARVQVDGEKVDSGLGDMPPFSQWVDKSARQLSVQMSQAK